MAERPRQGREEAPRGLSGQRMRVAIVVATVFGLPLCLMLVYLLTRGARLTPPFAQQPGGELEGRVLDPGGAPLAGEPVRVLLYPRGGEPSPFTTLESGPDGAFRARVPAIDGCYVVHAGGGRWVETAREASLAGGATPDLVFTLQPAAELHAEIARADGGSVRGGRYYLRRRADLLGLPLPSAIGSGAFEGSTLVRGGLQPGRWELSIELEDGTRAAFELDLPEGRTEVSLPPL